MSRVLLIVPPLQPDELYSRGSKSSASIIPPLGLGYIAAYLMKHGHECRIIDGIATPVPMEEICEIAVAYDVVGVTALSTYVKRVIELIHTLKTGAVEAPVVVGGPHVTALPESLLIRGADFVVIGEGEDTMLELVEALAKNTSDFSAIRGLMYRTGNGFVKTDRRLPIDPLDQVPMPARELLPMSKYCSSIARASEQPSHSLMVSRGCPGVCTFCNKRTFGVKTRRFSVDRVVEEFFALRDIYGAKDIAVWDDNFTSDENFVVEVCQRLRKEDLGVSWSVEARIDCVNRKILEALRNAGCTYIAYGIESGSQRILDSINKRITKSQIRSVVSLTRDVGIAMRGYFMMGIPTETKDEIRQTLDFAIELDVELASFTLFVPLPGTTEYQRALRSGTFPDPEYYFNRIVPEFNFPDRPLYIPEGMTEKQLLKMHRHAYNRYYFRPSMLIRKLAGLRSFADIRIAAQGALTLIGNFKSR